VGAALDLVDASGLSALSMRSVADQLGVEAMSLYRHVANKDTLLDALVDRVIDEMVLPTPVESERLGWRAALAFRAHSMRDVLLRHPWAAGLIEGRTTPTEIRLTFNEHSTRMLLDHGLSPEKSYAALLAIDSYVYGFVAQEVWFPVSREERPELIAGMQAQIDPRRFRGLAATMQFLLTRGETGVGAGSRKGQDADFGFGLDAMLHGLAANVAKPPSGPKPSEARAQTRSARRR
jgi:AcrR family transcriptional regulator